MAQDLPRSLMLASRVMGHYQSLLLVVTITNSINYYDKGWKKPGPVTFEVGMAVADFSNKHLGAGDGIIISAWLTHRDNGALIELDIGSCSTTWVGEIRVVSELCDGRPNSPMEEGAPGGTSFLFCANRFALPLSESAS
jgi:hypothetical protein